MGKCVFNTLWVNKEEYKDWIAASNDKRCARCIACKTKVIIGSMGESALKEHMKTQKHQKHLKSLKTSHRLFMPISPKTSSNDVADSTVVPQQPSTSLQSTTPSSIASFMSKEQVMDAEILWALKVIKSRFSYNSCEGSSKLFARMFPDSVTAKQFSCGATKCAYMCCFGLAPYYKELLFTNLQDVDLFTLLFDESLNKSLQEKQMDIHIRYWNSKECQIKTQYFTSAFIGHARADDILAAFQKSVDKLDLSKLLHVSMDGPNVNWKFYESLEGEIKREYNRDIICIGSCGLHIMNNSFKHGASSTDWNISGILSSLYWLFKDSPAKREDFLTVSVLKKLPIKFCGYRWLENVPVLERAIEIWPDLKIYVQNVEKNILPKVNSKTFHIIAEAVKDEMILIKLNFYMAVAKLLLPFLEVYQNDKPLVPFFAGDIVKLINQLIDYFNILKADKKNITTARKLCQFDFSDVNNYNALEKVSVGFVGDKLIKEKKKQKTISDSNVINLLRDCRGFIVKLIQTILAKSPIRYSLVRHASCIDPRKMASQQDSCVDYMKQVLLHFCHKQIVAEEDCDALLLKFKDFLESTVSKYSVSFTSFEPKSDRLDTFLNGFLNKDSENEKLWRVMKILMILSHGQATVERGFSINKSLEIENLKTESYIAQRLIYENSNSSNELHDTIITKEMRKYVSSSRQKYMLHLEEQQKIENAKISNDNRKRKIEELNYLKSKKAFLQADITAMENSAEELCNKAESSKKISLFIKANALRKDIKEKASEIKELDGQISEKEKEVN